MCRPVKKKKHGGIEGALKCSLLIYKTYFILRKFDNLLSCRFYENLLIILESERAAVTWLKYCQYGVKLYPIIEWINQSSINQRVSAYLDKLSKAFPIEFLKLGFDRINIFVGPGHNDSDQVVVICSGALKSPNQW